MSQATPSAPPASEQARTTRVFLSAGVDAGKYVEEIRGAFAREAGFEVVKHSPNIPLVDAEFDLELQHVDIAVVILTPGYLSTAQAMNEYSALLRAVREEALHVFRVVGSPVSEEIYAKLSIHPSQVIIEKPLGEMEPAEREHALAMLVRSVETAVAGSARRREYLQRGKEKVPAEGPPRILLSWSASLLERYPMFSATYEILKRVSRDPLPPSTALLLVIVAEAGWEDQELPWSGVWLSREIGEVAIQQLRSELRESSTEDEFDDGTGELSQIERVIKTAAGIAQHTSGSDEIHARHLVAALLTDPRGRAMEALERRNIDLTTLRRNYFEFVRRTDDDHAAWSKILLGRQVRVYRMAGFHADDTRGEDLLGIEQDVLAFATLIAARSVTPPLSIGLFGEWGSGKSFFMRHLRNAVAGLARDAARSGQMQRDQPFYKRIVQIEFNAWHYVEGNLWASLVEHIFRNLSVPGDPPSASEELQKQLMKDVKFTGELRAKADEEVQRAQREVDAARARVEAAEQEHQRQRDALAKLAAKEVASDLTAEEVRSAVGPVLDRLGIPAVAASAQDLLGALSEARALVDRGRGFAISLVRGPGRWIRTILLIFAMVVGPVVYWLVAVLLRRAGDEVMAQLTALASGAATLLAAGAGWVRSQVKWGSDRLAEVEKAQREVDRRLAEKEAEHTRELRARQERLRLVQADYEAARASQLESEKRAAEARARLEEASVARLLASFIEDRAASADYRKHLGVLALVRNDFETLSGLIEEENWQLSPPGHDDGRYPEKKRFDTLEHEENRADRRINRIVLYIDDMDRCPPNKVVEVLQAVHLLLAFPLFVVVVGVDARWVKRSLEVRYRELLHGGDAQAKDSAASAALLIGKATTDDYLEKIFQVPFWLRPMDETHTERMVRGLLGSSVASVERAAADGVQASEPAPGGSEEQHATDEAARGDSSPTVLIPGGLPGPGRPTAVGGLTVPRELQAVAPEEPQVNLESLVFQPEELEFMAALAPLLDRSPRALKRFVNVYRLIKAGLTPAEQRAFLAQDAPAAPYRAVLFLLAVDTGLPKVAENFFLTLRTVSAGSIETLVGLVKEKTTPTTLTGAPRWGRLEAWLRPLPNAEPRFDSPLAVLAEWEPRVMRYSFRAQD
jgi:hypothetical protein